MKYENIAKDIGKLVDEKNKSYGNSFHESCKIMELLYPLGIPPEKYKSVLALVRILDKIQRLVTDPNYNSENSWADIAGYCILMLGEANQAKDPLPKKDEWKTKSGARLQSEEDIVVQSKDTNWYDFNNPELRDSGIR